MQIWWSAKEGHWNLQAADYSAVMYAPSSADKPPTEGWYVAGDTKPKECIKIEHGPFEG